jgi:muconolactone D-isomerase
VIEEVGWVQFLVRIDIVLPPAMPEQQRADLLGAERDRGSELVRAGRLQQIWRVPGRFSNWSLYNVDDATQLHELISSLPLFPWMSTEVHPLACHPLSSVGEGEWA